MGPVYVSGTSTDNFTVLRTSQVSILGITCENVLMTVVSVKFFAGRSTARRMARCFIYCEKHGITAWSTYLNAVKRNAQSVIS